MNERTHERQRKDMLLLLVLLATPQDPAPMVEAPTPPAKFDAPFYEVRALAAATVPLNFNGANFLVGLRAEVDVWRLAVVATMDHPGSTPLTLSPTTYWTGLAGGSVLARSWGRVRLLGGVVIEQGCVTSLGAAVGVTGRAGWSFLAAEAGLTFAPIGGVRMLDARGGLVLSGGLFELHAGYRALFVDSTTGGTAASLFSTGPLSGPTLALGFAL